ncbi:class I SAM-dependent methyltransferase [Patescibacteria group bacterium]|nr:class I SAM-dependent methyltransferase [Patescibacteria group bacterium]
MKDNQEYNYRKRIYNVYVSQFLEEKKRVFHKDLEEKFVVHKGYFKRHLPKDKNAKILDAGCGCGGFLYFLQKEGYQNSYGIDISQEQIDTARELGIRNLERADILEYLKNRQNTLDLITLRDVLEHFKKDEIILLLDEIYRALKKEGKIIILTLNSEGPFWGKRRYGDFTHETAFTTKSLGQVLKTCGFKKISFYPVEPIIHGVKSLVRFLLWRVIRVFLRTYLLIETGSPGSGILTQNLIVVGEKKE